VIGAGESSGSLGPVLENLADDLEARQALQSKLIGASLYPAIVTLVAIVIVIFLVSYVVPQVAGVFAGTKRALPFLTVVMLGISDFVRSYGWFMLAVLLLAAVGFRLALRNEAFRERFDAQWLRLPLIGRLSRSYNAARFAGTLAMLAGAGVPILKALQAAAETLNNRALRADAMDALVLVREGAPLASALAQKKRFPGLVAMFARLGEQTGQLPLMLQRAATQLSTEVQRRAMHLATISGAPAHRRHGAGGHAHRAGRAHAHHPAQPVRQIGRPRPQRCGSAHSSLAQFLLSFSALRVFPQFRTNK
jgi:general secretion pathway protein F